MELQDYVQQLKREGFAHVYDWTDARGTTYAPHAHKGKVSMYIVSGSIQFELAGKIVDLKTGDRFDVPVGVEHIAKVGSDGCVYVVGEMIEGDS